VVAPVVAAVVAAAADDPITSSHPGSLLPSPAHGGVREKRKRRRTAPERSMNIPLTRLSLRKHALACLAAAGLLLLGCTGGHEQTAANSAEGAQANAQKNAQPPTGFPSPEEAVRAFATALHADDAKAVTAIMGPGGEDIISSGDEVADKQRYHKFLALYDQKHVLTTDAPDRRTLVVGDADWPFPVPIVKEGNSWHLDAAAGREEILNRRIGENELSVIQVCKAIADAQREYALRDPDGDGLEVYARKFLSDPGKRDGLYWPTAEGEPPSPLGELAAAASAEGYKRLESGPAPYHGYYYRMLESQGPHAPDGAIDYVVNGKMPLGFAVVAWPAEHDNSGVMTFLMGPDGVVYQQNLGEDTVKLAGEIKAFDPGEGWTKVE
jgi:hypothetical protein